MTDTVTIVSLPRQLTPLIGRQSELEAILSLIRNGQQLVTITGIGGMGKTRLAHQVALEIEPEFVNGAIFVPLADVREANQIPQEIGRILGSSSGDIDVDGATELIGNDPRLLVLDNLEQLSGAADFVTALLQRLQNLNVLCTSQIPLDIEGEQLFPLDPMMTPGEEDLPEGPAIELFVQRAKAANPHQQFGDAELPVVAEICRMLDGIPLALELAAGRTSIFSLPELQKQLDNRLDVLAGGKRSAPERQRTMRDAIAWSYDLLDEDEKRLFRYLGVFAGGISLDAIEHTLQTLEITESTQDVLSKFVQRGLMTRIEAPMPTARYLMLETMREYGAERLAVEGDEFSARLAHANYALEVSRQVSPMLSSDDPNSGFKRHEVDRDNIRTAADWSSEHRPEITLEIIGSLWKAFDAHGSSHLYIGLGKKAAESEVSPAVLVRGLFGIGVMEVNLQDDPDAGQQTLHKALYLARDVSDRHSEARILNALGTNALYTEQSENGRNYLHQALKIAEANNDPLNSASARANLAAISNHEGDHDLALSQFLQVLRDFTKAQNLNQVGVTHCNVGIVYKGLRDWENAQHHLYSALEIATQLNHVPLMLFTLGNLGEIQGHLQDYPAAFATFERGIDIARANNRKVHELELGMSIAMFLAERGNIPEAIQRSSEALQVTSSTAGVAAITVGALLTAIAADESGDAKTSAALIGFVDSNADSLQGLPISISSSYKRLCSKIPTESINSQRVAFEAGKTWDLEFVVSLCVERTRTYLQTLGTTELHTQPGQHDRIPNLTTREQEVLSMMAQGRTNAEIAEEMYISLRTITTHASNIFAKLNVKNRSSAVAIAQQAGLLANA